MLRVEPGKERVYVEGLNMVKRHTAPPAGARARSAGRRVGGVIEREGPIHVSNVMLLDPKDGKPTRVGVEREDGKPLPRRAALRARGSTDEPQTTPHRRA